MTSFADLALIEPLLRAVAAEGYVQPTPIQQQAIPVVLAGRDVLGCAQTGTGKTAAFSLPILQRLAGSPRRGPRLPRVLVLTPTRELATQIGDSFAAYGRNTSVLHTVVFGGVGQAPQERALRHGVDVLVATPGRLLDLMGQRIVRLDDVDFLVLDEADRMLDMGFIHDVRRILEKVPTQRQTLLFSATMPPDIRRLANDILRDPVTVAVTPPATTAERIEQSVYFVEKADKRALLEHLLRDPGMTRTLVFTRTKHGANRVAETLRRAHIAAEAIHGNKSQGARERALDHFKRGLARVLVATDLAGRGIDIEEVSHVVNFDLPNIAESYVHRIGRTARAGAAGIAISFCEMEERPYLDAIERLTGIDVDVVAEHPYRSSAPPPPRGVRPPARGQGTAAGASNGERPRAQAPRRDDGRSRGRDGDRPARLDHGRPPGRDAEQARRRDDGRPPPSLDGQAPRRDGAAVEGQAAGPRREQPRGPSRGGGPRAGSWGPPRRRAR